MEKKKQERKKRIGRRKRDDKSNINGVRLNGCK